MSDEPSNAASEYLVVACAFLSAGRPDWDMRPALTDDFRYEDRRLGRLFGEVEADSFQEFMLSSWQTGAGQPQFRVPRVVAVRGDRFALCRLDLDYGNGMRAETLHLIGLDATLTLHQVSIEFDVEAVDRAIAELDRLGGHMPDSYTL